MKINFSTIIGKFLMFLLLFYCLFFNAFSILQLELFNNIIISYTQFKTIILTVEILYFISYFSNHKVKSVYSGTIIALLFCSILSFLLGVIEFDSISIPLGVITNNLLLIFVIYSLGVNNENNIKLKKIFNIIIFYGVINAILCIVQYLTGSLVYSKMDETMYKSVFYFGRMVRSCGLYSSALEVGLLLSMCSIYCVYNHCNLNSWKKIINVMLIVLFIIGIITTRTRNVYLFFCFTLLFIIISKIKKNNNSNFVTLYLLITILISLFITINGSNIGNNFGNIENNLYSTNSLNIRLNSWQSWSTNFFSQNILEIVFGNCRGQATGWATDNVYFEYLSSFGMIGLLLILRLLHLIIIRLKNKKDIYSKCGIASILTLFSFGIFNLPETFLMIYLPFLISFGSYTGGEKNEMQI